MKKFTTTYAIIIALWSGCACAATTYCENLRNSAVYDLETDIHLSIDRESGVSLYENISLEGVAPERVNRALISAAEMHDITLMKFLLARGAEPNWHDVGVEFDITPLTAASWCGNIHAVELLLKHGANPDVPSRFPFAGGLESATVYSLHAAFAGSEFEGGDPRLVCTLISAGADLGARDGYGKTPKEYSYLASAKLRSELDAVDKDSCASLPVIGLDSIANDSDVSANAKVALEGDVTAMLRLWWYHASMLKVREESFGWLWLAAKHKDRFALAEISRYCGRWGTEACKGRLPAIRD